MENIDRPSLLSQLHPSFISTHTNHQFALAISYAGGYLIADLKLGTLFPLQLTG